MKTGFCVLLTVCVFTCAGCASVKPAPEPPAAAVAAPATNSVIVHAVKDWWATPPPDFAPRKKDGGYGWWAFGEILQALGPMLAR